MALYFPCFLVAPRRRGTPNKYYHFLSNKQNFPCFHAVHSVKPGNTVRVISTFLLRKCLKETIVTRSKATKLASGDALLDRCDKQQHDKLMNPIALGDVPMSVTPHRTMNTIRGAMSHDELMELTMSELIDIWSYENVINVKRIKIRRDAKKSKPSTSSSNLVQVCCLRPYHRSRLCKHSGEATYSQPSQMFYMPEIRS